MSFQLPSRYPRRNLVLCGLGAADRGSISSYLEPVLLKQRDVLQEPNKPIDSIYFIESGLVSLKTLTKGCMIETAIVGHNGVIGATVALGAMRSIHHSTVLIAGSAFRIRLHHLRSLFVERPLIRECLLRYIQCLFAQCSQTALCCVHHGLEERVACWILLACEALNLDSLSITHDQLALNLGLRRPGLTEALIRFEEKRIIRRARGFVHVRERQLLRDVACDCCAVVTNIWSKPTVFDAGSGAEATNLGSIRHVDATQFDTARAGS